MPFTDATSTPSFVCDYRDLADHLVARKTRLKSAFVLLPGTAKMVRSSLASVPNHTRDWYFNSSRILSLSSNVDDQILAHELAIVAVSKGESRAMTVVAESEDQILVAMGHSQRFGTVECGDRAPSQGGTASCDQPIPDQLRRAMGVGTLAASQAFARASGGSGGRSQATSLTPSSVVCTKVQDPQVLVQKRHARRLVASARMAVPSVAE